MGRRALLRWRLYLVGVAVLLVVISIAAVLLRPTEPDREPRSASNNPAAVAGRAATVRGAIFDATGQLLAADVPYESLYADPARVANSDRLASVLAPALGLPESDLRTRLSTRQRDPILVQPMLTAEQSVQTRRLGRLELLLRTETRRAYPEGSLAAAVLGVVGRDGRGLTGMEAGLDAELSGRTVTGIAPTGSVFSRGADVTLTIDRFVQYVAETELEKAVKAASGTGGVVVVMEPSTGAVLAMAAWPGFDPRQTVDEGQVARYRHPAVSEAYEARLLLRVVVMAAALDAGAITPDYAYYYKGTLAKGAAVGESIISAGPENMTQVMQRGTEDGAINVAERLRMDRMQQYLAAFGFGQLTGVSMTAESIGQVRLTGVGAGRPFGQGIFVTPLQLTAALSAIANGGILMQPYLVQEVKMGEARLAYDPRLVRQVISPLAARAVREMMLATVDGAEATAQKAAVPQYRVAGVASVPGSVAPSADSASFVGFVPADSPRFAILVKIDRPQTSALGAEVAAPAFRAVAQHLLAYYRVSPPLTTAGLHR